MKSFLNQLKRTVDVIRLSKMRLSDHNWRFSISLNIIYFIVTQKIRAGISAILVFDAFNCEQFAKIKINFNGCEDVWINLNQNKSLIVGSVFRHPSYIKLFEDEFVSTIKSFKANQDYIVFGDDNINYSEVMVSQKIMSYANHINSIGLYTTSQKTNKNYQNL